MARISRRMPHIWPCGKPATTDHLRSHGKDILLWSLESLSSNVWRQSSTWENTLVSVIPRHNILAMVLAPILLSGCIATQPTAAEPTEKNRLTTGQVQLTLKKDQTTQSEVLEAFGAPNLVTVNSSGEDVWTYQRNATVTNASNTSTYGTVILFGGSTRTSGLEQSSRNMTLIIRFRDHGGTKRVSAFDSRSSSF